MFDNGTILPTDADAPIDLPGRIETDTPFMLFWWDLNEICERHRIPDILYGEARDLWGRRADAPRPEWGSQEWAETYSDDLGENPDF